MKKILLFILVISMIFTLFSFETYAAPIKDSLTEKEAKKIAGTVDGKVVNVEVQKKLCELIEKNGLYSDDYNHGTFDVNKNWAGDIKALITKGPNNVGETKTCVGYAKYVFAYLYGLFTYRETYSDSDEYVRASCQGVYSLTYDDFINNNIQPGAYIDGGTHTVILFAYDKNSVTIYDGNWGRVKDETLSKIMVTTLNWEDLRNRIRYTCSKIVSPKCNCGQYETYKNGNTKILGACKECHKAYNWQDTFSRISNKTASLKNSKKNYKISVYNTPYEDATKTTAKKAVDKFAIVGTVKNAYGNEWYAIDYPDDVKKVCYTAYIYKSTLADNYDIVTTNVQEAKKYDSANVSTKKHTHNYNYDNGRCYCGEKKQVAQQTYEESTLKINLTQYPSQHTQGNNFGLRGTISSNYKIKKIYGYIKQNGNVIQSTEDTPNTKSVDVKNQNLNNNLIFDRLSPGNYTLEVQAVDASGNSIRVSKDFTVVGEVVRAESTLSINLEKYPVTLNAGSSFGLRGSVNSNYDISIVRGYVINSNGQTVLSSKDTPYSSSLNIKSARLNNDLVFNNLSAGNYTLKVVATDSSGRTVEVSKGFSVVSPQKTNNSSLSINLEKYPVTLNVGSSYGLRGSITSNYNISVVRGYVTNSSGQTVLSSKDTPNSTDMDIKPSNLNWDLVFNNLSAGNYTMRVVAIDASGRTVEATKNFTVKAKEAYVDNSPNGNGVTGVVDIPSSWDNLSIRSGPSTSYQIVGSMNDGVKCTVYPNKTSNGWYYVNYNGIWGYASGNQINLNTSSNTQTQNTRVGIVNIPSSWDNLSIRSGPSTNYQIVGSMNQGARCTVYPDKASNGWYYVEYNGVRGYASGKQINLQ